MSTTTLVGDQFEMQSDTSAASSSDATEKYSVVEFEGPEDKWDPKNFSHAKKWSILFAVAHGAVVVTCASSLYVRSLASHVEMRQRLILVDFLLWTN